MENSSDKNRQEEDSSNENGAALSMASLKTQIEALHGDIQTSKKQSASLKVMLYTGFIILLAGFFYSSGMFKQSQKDSVKASFHKMRNRVNHELLVIQKGLFSEILRLQEQLEEASARGPAPAEVKDTIERMNALNEWLQPQGVEAQELIEEIRQNSQEFLKVYDRNTDGN